MKLSQQAEDCRHDGPIGTNCGYFVFRRGNATLRVIASDGLGWDHVSVSLATRCPTWDEMCFVKRQFFGPGETVVQFHPSAEAYVNYHPFCLHRDSIAADGPHRTAGIGACMRYFTTDEGEFAFSVLGNPPCYDGMAQLAAASKHKQHPKVRDSAWIEDYLRWPSTFALLMTEGYKLAGYMLLKRLRPRDRHLVVDAAFAQEAPNEELAYAQLSCGLYHWLRFPGLQFHSLGPARNNFHKAIIRIPEDRYLEDHERLERYGWRSCGLEERGGIRWRQFQLCVAYRLDVDSVLAKARQFSLTRS